MHLSLIGMAVAIALVIRCTRFDTPASRHWHWQQTLSQFLLPPLLLLITAVAVMMMGTQGRMFGVPVGGIGYALGASFLSAALIVLGIGFWQGWRSLQRIKTYPLITWDDTTGRLLQSPMLFAARVGFWESELVVSQGLLATLTPNQINAVVAHEQAHQHYRDTFCFFWFGCVRKLTFWLPNTELLWQELLLRRELRADQWAAQRVDPLLLAESLLLVMQAPLHQTNSCWAAFGNEMLANRLEARIEALLTSHSHTEPDNNPDPCPILWLSSCTVFLPLLTVFFHH